MKKFLVALTAAAVVALPASHAMAKKKTVTVTLDGFCDSFTITNSGGVYSAADDTATCSTWYGTGLGGKLKPDGKAISFGLISPSNPATSYYVTFSYPFVTGGAFKMYITNDGNGDGVLALTDTYTVAGTPSRGQRGSKSASSLAHH
jgi:hypothetical protein